MLAIGYRNGVERRHAVVSREFEEGTLGAKTHARDGIQDPARHLFFDGPHVRQSDLRGRRAEIGVHLSCDERLAHPAGSDGIESGSARSTVIAERAWLASRTSCSASSACTTALPSVPVAPITRIFTGSNVAPFRRCTTSGTPAHVTLRSAAVHIVKSRECAQPRARVRMGRMRLERDGGPAPGHSVNSTISAQRNVWLFR